MVFRVNRDITRGYTYDSIIRILLSCVYTQGYTLCTIVIMYFGPFPSKDMQTPLPPPLLRFVTIFMKDARCNESNEKSILSDVYLSSYREN